MLHLASWPRVIVHCPQSPHSHLDCLHLPRLWPYSNPSLTCLTPFCYVSSCPSPSPMCTTAESSYPMWQAAFLPMTERELSALYLSFASMFLDHEAWIELDWYCFTRSLLPVKRIWAKNWSLTVRLLLLCYEWKRFSLRQSSRSSQLQQLVSMWKVAGWFSSLLRV